ncbi:DMT family transporter [Dickeya chrysanthemi]|uniref:DMT family transporter n=1 Tax=Dickeya chrysanthemi TaxID=556 RepID=UPI00259FEF4E|nr:DMT family transporter [Dickeya chrysanthemi]WJM87442.1 DMT family transporter [Dickeya chrysanthemi]
MKTLSNGNHFRGWVATTIAWILLGTNYWVIHQFLFAVPPIWASALRALPAGLVLLLIVQRLPSGKWWWRSAILGSLSMGLFFLLLYIATQRLPSSIAASIGALSPLVFAGVAWLLIHERVNARFLGGAAFGIVGILLIVGAKEGTIDVVGVAAAFGAIILMAIGAVLGKLWDDGTPVLTTTAWQLMAGGIELLIVAVLAEGAPPVVNSSELIALSYVSLISTAVSYACLFTGFRYLGAGMVGLLGLLSPVTGVLMGVTLASESLTLTQSLGIGLILLGIVLAQKK